MANLNLSTTILLPALVAAGFITTMVFSFNNGTFPAITAIIDDAANQPTIPGSSDVALIRRWTGIGAIDKQLTVLLLFFWPLLSGRDAAASLHALHFSGQLGAYWTLILLEARREGNKRRLMAYTTLIGLLYQNLSVAVTIPAWALLALLTHPRSTRSSTLTARLSIPAADARVLPYAMALGYLLPTLAMALPSPAVVTPAAHQLAIALWQLFPLWVALAGYVLRPVCAFSSAPTTPLDAYRAAERVHLFALLVAAVPHAATVALSAGAALVPSLVSPALHPARVFVPRVSAPGTLLAGGLGEGARRFMQWDEVVSCAAVVVWAGSTYLADARVKGGAGRFGVVGVVARAVGWGVVGGPAAGAVVLVWCRDEVVLGAGGVREGRGVDDGIEEYFLLDLIRYIKPDIEV